MASTSQIRQGTGATGDVYEQIMIANIIFETINDESVTDFKLSSNDARFGKFDDIVVETFGENEKKYAIQLKHVENDKSLTTAALTAESGQLSLKEYFHSFEKIHQSGNTHKLVLFTNRNLDANDGQQITFGHQGFSVKIKKLDMDPLLKTRSSGNCYKLEDLEVENENLSSLELQAYKKFFEKFYLYTNQSNVRQIENTLGNNFQKKFDCKKDEFKIYLDFIRKWYYDRTRENVLDKKIMKRVVALNVLSSFIQPIQCGQVNDKMKILQEAINNFEVTICKKETHRTTYHARGNFETEFLEDDTLPLKIAKIWGDGRDKIENSLQEINKVIKRYNLDVDYVTDVNNLSEMDLSKILWLMDTCPLIVNEDKTTSVTINFCQKEKFILIVKTKEEIVNRSVFRNLSNMNSDPQLYENITSKFKCTIQGKDEINLQQLISINEDFPKIFTPSVLVEMVEGPYQIGGKKETLPVPYIDRYLTRSIINYNYLKNIDSNTLVVIDNFRYVQDLSKFRGFSLIRGEEYIAKLPSNENKLETTSSVENLDQNNDVFDSNFDNPLYYFERECSNKHFEKIHEVNSVQQSHHLRITQEGRLEWIQSHKYDIDDLKEFCDSDFESVSEMAWYDEAQNDLNLVIGDPGMGKSVLMQNLKNNVDPTFWTVFFYNEDIVSLIEFFEKRDVNKYYFQEFVLTRRYPKLKIFDKEFLGLLLKEECLLFVWEALDEISVKNLDRTIEIICSLSEENIRQWITCRSHLKRVLEKKLGIFSKTIMAMTEEQQNLYIRERLNRQDIDAEIEIIKELIVHHDILGIPLQLYMLTELFRQDPSKYSNLAYNLLNAVDIYRYFIEELFNFYFRKHPPSHSNERFKNMQMDFYKHSALKSMRFPKFNDHSSLLKEIQTDGDPVGIITEVTDKDVPHFLHTSICEYFVAVYFAEDYKYKGTLSPEIVAVILKSEFRNVRFFFDLLLAEKSSLHVAVLYKNIQFLRNNEDLTTCTDFGGRNLLHLACSWGQDYPTLSVEIEEGTEEDTYYIDDSVLDESRVMKEDEEYAEIIEFLLDKCKLSETDDLFNLTPIRYAEKTNNLYATVFILKHQNQLQFDKRMANQMYWSAKFGYLNFLEMFRVIPLIRMRSDNSILLHRSVLHENFLERLLRIEQYNKAIDDRDNENQTALLTACQQNSLDASLILIHSGANNKIFSQTGKLPLHFACQYGNTQLVNLLTNSDTINAQDNEKLTPLHIACFNGHAEIARFLVKSGAKVDSQDSENRTPLVSACINGHEEIINFLITEKNVNLDSSEGTYCLHSAASNGHRGSVELLVNKGAGVNSTSEDLRTALHFACERGCIDVVDYLCGLPEIEINKTDKNRWSPLHHAVNNGQGRIVNILIRKADVNKVTNRGRTPIFIACRKGYEQIARSLIGSGANIRVKTIYQRTPLHEAVQYGHFGIVNLLLGELNQGYIDEKDSRGWTALHLACMSGNTEVVQLLLDHGSNINAPSLNQRTPLHYACQYGHENIVVVLLKFQADVSATDHKKRTPLHLACDRGLPKIVKHLTRNILEIDALNNENWTPLHFACQGGHVSVVKLLLDLGSNVNAKTKDGWTPLHFASLRGYGQIIQLLKSYGSDINCVTNRKWTPLHLACDNNRDEVVQQLTLYQKINTNIPNSEGLTPLHIACEKQNLHIIRRLLNAGANAYATSPLGWTPLHLASARGYTKVCRELSDYYIDVDIQDGDKRTPLFIACQHGHDSVVELLIEKRAKLNIRSQKGWSLLHIASDKGFVGVVDLLLRANMEMNLFDDSKNTPLHLACQNGHLEVVKLLTDAGADVNVTNIVDCTPYFLAAKYKHYSVVKFLKKKPKKAYCLNVIRVLRCNCDFGDGA